MVLRPHPTTRGRPAPRCFTAIAGWFGWFIPHCEDSALLYRAGFPRQLDFFEDLCRGALPPKCVLGPGQPFPSGTPRPGREQRERSRVSFLYQPFSPAPQQIYRFSSLVDFSLLLVNGSALLQPPAI